MSSISPASATVLAAAGDARPDGLAPGPLGLARATWVKIGVLAALLVALFWVNLARLWAKTNPFTGQGNWEHAIFIPLVGLYYLYVWRDQLLETGSPSASPSQPSAGTRAAPADRWSLPGVWALVLAVPVLVALAAAPALASGTAGLRDLLGSLADRGLTKLVPFVLAVVVYGGAAVGFVYVKREELAYPSTQAWLTTVWRGLGAWLLAMVCAWGGLFLVYFLGGILVSWLGRTGSGNLSGRFEGLLAFARYAVAAVGALGLAHVAFHGKSLDWRRRYDAVLTGSSGWFGAFVMVWGIAFSFWGIYPGQNDFFKDVGMVVALFGVVKLVGVWRVMRVAWFPIVFLFVALPWPDQVYSWVALPLQNFAAKVGVFTLSMTGVDANQFGTKIVMAGAGGQLRTLNVAEACAGLKSLMTFVFVAAAVAFLSPRLLWQKLFIVASAVPIAILCNAGRVAGQGLLDFYVSRQWSENFAHGFAGLVMLIPGFFMILAVCWVLDHLFVEEADDAVAPDVRGAITAAVATLPAAVASTAGSAAAGGLVAARAAAVAGPRATPALNKAVLTIPKKPAAAVSAAGVGQAKVPPAAPAPASVGSIAPAATVAPTRPALSAVPTAPAAGAANRVAGVPQEATASRPAPSSTPKPLASAQ
ncbi:MAG: hypothetical protein JWO31_1833, partial [Phycisphaerales bacterium]|nr:hypothetical protein [Phycisphaerales bacterium]